MIFVYLLVIRSTGLTLYVDDSVSHITVWQTTGIYQQVGLYCKTYVIIWATGIRRPQNSRREFPAGTAGLLHLLFFVAKESGQMVVSQGTE